MSAQPEDEADTAGELTGQKEPLIRRAPRGTLTRCQGSGQRSSAGVPTVLHAQSTPQSRAAPSMGTHKSTGQSVPQRCTGRSPHRRHVASARRRSPRSSRLLQKESQEHEEQSSCLDSEGYLVSFPTGPRCWAFLLKRSQFPWHAGAFPVKLRSIWQTLREVGGHGSVWERRCAGWAGVQASQETVTQAVVEGPGRRACDDGVLGDPCFGRGVGVEGEHVERELGDDPQGAGAHGPRQLWGARLVG